MSTVSLGVMAAQVFGESFRFGMNTPIIKKVSMESHCRLGLV
jgi:hypothetical protein